MLVFRGKSSQRGGRSTISLILQRTLCVLLCIHCVLKGSLCVFFVYSSRTLCVHVFIDTSLCNHRVDRKLVGTGFSPIFSPWKDKIKNQQNRSSVTLGYWQTESLNDYHRIATKVLYNLIRGCNSITFLLQLQFYLRSLNYELRRFILYSDKYVHNGSHTIRNIQISPQDLFMTGFPFLLARYRVESKGLYNGRKMAEVWSSDPRALLCLLTLRVGVDRYPTALRNIQISPQEFLGGLWDSLMIESQL